MLGWWLRPPAPPPEIPRTPLTNLEFDSPSGLSREAFLEQVQALAGLPDALDLQDPIQVERLRSAFKAHPWVRLVADLHWSNGRPYLALDFRRPVLLVQAWGHPVDAQAVLLPKLPKEFTSALVVDASKRAAPSGRLGQRCPEIRDLAQMADRLPPRTEWRGATLSRDHEDFLLEGSTASGRFRVRWRPGLEVQLLDLPALGGFSWQLREGEPPLCQPIKP
ncbi:MAG: hypothetical protein SNJ75_07910 [Gemmataceae bacterium]